MYIYILTGFLGLVAVEGVASERPRERCLVWIHPSQRRKPAIVLISQTFFVKWFQKVNSLTKLSTV